MLENVLCLCLPILIRAQTDIVVTNHRTVIKWKTTGALTIGLDASSVTLQKLEVCTQWNVPSKWFKIYYFMYRKSHEKNLLGFSLIEILHILLEHFVERKKPLLFLEECSFQSSGKTKILMHVRKNSRGQKNLLGPPATRPTYSGNNQKTLLGPWLNRSGGSYYFDNLR